MTEKLNRIKTVLNQVINDGKKIDTDSIIGAIDDLEQFPMTKLLLQATRIGKVLNEVRKLTSGSLSNRIKGIIRSWQILVDDAKTDTVVVPFRISNGSSNCASPISNCLAEDITSGSKTVLRRINGSSASLPTLDSNKVFVSSPASQSSSVISNVDRNNHHKKVADDSKHSKKRQLNLHASNADGSLNDCDGKPPNKCARLNPVDSSYSAGNGSQEASALSNRSSALTQGEAGVPKLRIRFGGNGKGCSASTPNNSYKPEPVPNAPVLSPGLNSTAKTFQLSSKDVDPQNDASSAVSGSTNRSSRQPPVNPAALPRVKSTAELLIQYGSEIKSQKKTNILEIEREPDFVPSALPETARPRRLRTQVGPSARNKGSSVNSAQDLQMIDSPAAFKKGKTSILEKFLASTVKYSDNDESDNSVVNDSSTYAVTNFVMNSTSASTTVSPPSVSIPAHQRSPPLTSKPASHSKVQLDASNSGTDRLENSETDAAIEDVELKRRHHKHKHKHKHRVKNKQTSHPITNLMDRRPDSLPLLPNVDPSNYPYPIPEVIEASEQNVERLLHREWEGLNCVVHDDTGENVSFTDMYTLGLHNTAENPPDSLLHMLPWVDLNGWRKHYFPDDALKYIDEFQLVKPR